ncbi:MAG: polysulfide reductase NrfD [Deltaproteobacteria bacterium]|nr:polysulfide reductase NrfD [Deltaproteobacteria bacterium]MBW2413094.1 polysulfide reductase NrfD [Deltaproteobacteria bacterium]
MAAITDPVPTSPEDYNEGILAVLAPPSPIYVVAVLTMMGLVGAGAAALAYQTYAGMGVTGLMHPVMWGVYITTFVFWVGIAHAGTLISAILYLFRAKWRNAINRGAEAMTVFSVITAGLFPLIHIGRLWKFYFMLPYPNQRGLWTNFKSPLEWDVFAVGTYTIISILFFAVGLIPDIAAARDRITDWRRHLYGVLALGWRGTAEQWRHHSRAVLHLSGLATPLVLSVHSVVSWDFAMSLVPGWHTTIFAPYFVAGAIFSGMAMVITVLVPVRKAFSLERFIRAEHFDNMGKFIVLTSTIVGYAYAVEYFMAWYSANPYEQMSFWHRAFGDYWWATWIMITCNVIVPLPLWLKRFRLNITWMWCTSILINIGMWFERFVIITTGLSHEYDPAAWGYYTPSWVELTILVASFAHFFMWFLLFLRMFPVIAIQEVKEEQYEHAEAH